MSSVLRIPVRPDAEPRARVLAVGDVCIRTDGGRLALERDPGNVVERELADRIREADLAICNLECTLASGRGALAAKAGPRLAAPPQLAGALRAFGFDLATLANNHILDAGAEGLHGTEAICREAGLATCGVGADREAAAHPYVAEIGGLRVAILALAEHEFGCAAADRPGAALLDPVDGPRHVRSARDLADVVLVCAHGGNEHYFAPSPRMQAWYRALVDAGAAAVLGHHPHAVQGVEVYNGAPIVYSAGNFLFDASGTTTRRWRTGLVSTLSLAADGVVDVELMPTEIADEDTPYVRRLPNQPDGAAFRARLEALCEVASDPARVRELWDCHCHANRRYYFRRFAGAAGVVPTDLRGWLRGSRASPRNLGVALAEFLARHATSPSRRAGHLARSLNLLRCPAHHEMLTTAVEMLYEGRVPGSEGQALYTRLAADG